MLWNRLNDTIIKNQSTTITLMPVLPAQSWQQWQRPVAWFLLYQYSKSDRNKIYLHLFSIQYYIKRGWLSESFFCMLCLGVQGTTIFKVYLCHDGGGGGTDPSFPVSGCNGPARRRAAAAQTAFCSPGAASAKVILSAPFLG